MSGFLNAALIRAAYSAQEDDGVPGIGRSPEADGEALVIVASTGTSAF
jgi:hypothetical protein